jgi:hypothetical protein
MLQLDTSGLVPYPSLRKVYTDPTGTFHLRDDCPTAQSPISCEIRFIADRTAKPCPNCAAAPPEPKKWWKLW